MARQRNMIYYKTQAEIELIRHNALLVGKVIAEVAKNIKPGVTTLELDRLAEQFIADHGAVPSFKNYKGYPFTACISVNDAVVHGFPNDQPLREGDIISYDVGVYKNGFHGDSAYTFAIGDVSEEVLALMRVTKESLYKGIEKAVAGNRVGDISFAIQEHTEKRHGYGVVRELVGHGLGRSLHEDPQVPNYGKRGSGPKMNEGMVIAIEPMINLGTRDVYYEDDGWTVRTRDHKASAHYEHNVCVRRNKADILSSFDEIEQAEQANPYLNASYYSRQLIAS
ncbi:MAG TPA: type I methionyl aminopeptidase [Chitinophagaceae bacterium]